MDMSTAHAITEDRLLSDARAVIAGNVRALMGRQRVTQTRLAADMHLSQPSISRRIGGEKAFSTDELVWLARYFEVEVTDLLDEVRSRCFPSLTLVSDPEGQMELSFTERPVLAGC